MPTSRPRYTVTDTADVRVMLDLAHRAWPEVADRKELLLRLAAMGSDTIRARLDERDQTERRARQQQAMRRAAELMDVELLLADGAWR